MQWLRDKIQREPVRTATMIESIIALAIGFGLDITIEQFALVMVAVTNLLGWFARGEVTPVADPRLPAPEPIAGHEPPAE